MPQCSAIWSNAMRRHHSYDARQVFIGQRLRAARVRRGFSQVEVAARLGVTYQQISKYERGASSLTALAALELANMFQVSVAWLLGQPERIGESPAAMDRLQDQILAAVARIADKDLQTLALR